MFSAKSRAFAVLAGIAVVASPAMVLAVRPVDPGNGHGHGNGHSSGDPDLVGQSITFKSHCNATTCTVNNLTLVVKNQGGGDAGNSRVEFYLSDDTTLTTTPDELSSSTDSLIHRVSLGTVKANKTKRRTVGGGLLKQLSSHSGQYVIAVLDADNTTSESDELNNVFVSEPIP
jgi:subtilase family serine protease